MAEVNDVSPSNPQVLYSHNDHLGTPLMLTNHNQEVVWQGTRTPFGEVVEESGNAGVVQQRGFPGQYHDREMGTYYNYYRDYDAALGRYVQSDPIGLRGGMNTYGYVLGNPVMYIDPLGLWPLGAPESGFGWGGVHVPSRASVTNQLQTALSNAGVCKDSAEASTVAEDIVAEVGWGDLPLAKALNEALSSGNPLSSGLVKKAKDFIGRLPEESGTPLIKLLGGQK